ncbi:hypothetical protein SAMN05444722_0837 [Rhodovulum sp. ES.010]|nr:hypothetical protein SAMN05444722_0837 [Rhodovulum sp. ES.010]
MHTPPSARRVAFILAVLALCLRLALVDRLLGWPDWLTVSSGGRGRIGM